MTLPKIQLIKLLRNVATYRHVVEPPYFYIGLSIRLFISVWKRCNASWEQPFQDTIQFVCRICRHSENGYLVLSEVSYVHHCAIYHCTPEAKRLVYVKRALSAVS